MHSQTLSRENVSFRLRVIAIVLFAVATAIGARLNAWLPNSPVPLTLQVLMVVLSGFVLGARDGFIAQLLYLQAILFGAPLTAAGLAGPAAFVGPTAGYLIAFPFAAWVAGALSHQVGRHAWAWRALGGLAALGVIYGLGMVWLAGFVGGLGNAWKAGVLPFIGADLLKVAIASAALALRSR